MKQTAVFLDRDGTINEQMGYINHLSRLVLLPRSAPGIRLLNQAGLTVIIITNQSGAARGYFPLSLVDQVNAHLQNLLAAEGAKIDAVYACTHGPRDGCPCRKPKPGLIHQAAQDLNLDLSRSYLVGDRYLDLETATNAGVKSILVLTGYGRGEYELFAPAWDVRPAHIAADLMDAAAWIIKDLQK